LASGSFAKFAHDVAPSGAKVTANAGGRVVVQQRDIKAATFYFCHHLEFESRCCVAYIAGTAVREKANGAHRLSRLAKFAGNNAKKSAACCAVVRRCGFVNPSPMR
jgi:GTP cyclohydrolase I